MIAKPISKRSIFNVCTAEVEPVVTSVTGHHLFPGIRPPALAVHWDHNVLCVDSLLWRWCNFSLFKALWCILLSSNERDPRSPPAAAWNAAAMLKTPQLFCWLCCWMGITVTTSPVGVSAGWYSCNSAVGGSLHWSFSTVLSLPRWPPVPSWIISSTSVNQYAYIPPTPAWQDSMIFCFSRSE